jgi:glycosyltransferase involved in cell wall biosynthesis
VEIDVSVVVPTKNEEITIKQFLDWCFEGFENSKLNGEIIILDNSDDNTPQIALANGAKVIKVSAQGLGNAYAAGRKAVSGKWVIMGDADCTYDFRDIGPFISKLEENYDFVVGNRFIGEIEKGAMPPHHQYFGSPLTSMIFKHGLQHFGRWLSDCIAY